MSLVLAVAEKGQVDTSLSEKKHSEYLELENNCRSVLLTKLFQAHQARYDDSSSMDILKPSIFTSRKPRKLDRTSYLNGLRGLACLFVVFHHGTEQFYPWIRAGFLSTPTATNLLSLPIVRIWLSGHAMVDIFFVISGYVLSAKPLRLAREGQHVEAYKTIASSTLRRGVRLYLPCLVHTLVVVCFMRVGWLGDRGLQKWNPAPSLIEELQKWLRASLVFFNPFSLGHDYESHLWTMPHEFQGSMVVYLSCLALARSTNIFRSLTLFILAAYWMYMTHWYYFLFTAGMVCADLHMILEPSINLDIDPEQPAKRSLLKRIFHGVAVFACLWLLSFPRFNEGADQSLGYASLVPWIPPSWRGEVYQSMWWLVITAPVFIAVLDSAGHESVYQKFLCSGFIQYLGDISFALYLCHGMWINSLGLEMVHSICGRWGFQMVEGDVGFVGVLILTSLVVMPLTFWHSEVFTRTVDKATLRLSARLTKL
ncbi:uncharacterized protein AB675_5788 [Cyphellophora attinorum]|uniref:Acyltransferase 3 domain-containing protein n=1 Tax=Cyphellophora attinorum TaxID=1664694 RepID=A0A0N1H2N6_9EURO|nr:uncharacterized protein AB675_5788 [Phialophora attinorum]KPI38797.1 hypothetical protein AB675_5788 [Phialophora attinorum]